MKELSASKMEQINGGLPPSCWWAIAGMAATIAGATLISGVGGLVIYQVALAAGAGGLATCQ